MTAELINFLRVCLDEDALWATEASRDGKNLAMGGVHWHWVSGETDTEITPDPSRETSIGEEMEGSLSLRSREEWPTISGMGDLPQFALYADEVLSTVGGHIVRHDPARILAEVDAKRQIVEKYEQAQRYASTAWGQSNAALAEAQTLKSVVLLLASAYANHPDYREEWRP